MNNWSVALSVKAFNALLSLGALFMVARHFGAAGKGHIAEALLPATTILIFIKMGLDTASAIVSRRDPWLREGILGAILLYFSVCSLVVVVLSSTICDAMWDAALPNVPLTLLAAALWLIPAQMCHDVAMNTLLGLGTFVRFNLIKLLQPVLFFLALAILLLTQELPLGGSLGLMRVIWLYPLSYALAAGVMVMLLSRHLPFRIRGSFRVCLTLLRLGGPIQLAFVLLYLNRRIDTWMIQRFLDPEDNGIYSVVVAFLEAAWFVSRPMSSLVLQQSASHVDTAMVGKVLRVSMTFSTLYLGLLALLGMWILSLAGGVFATEGYAPLLCLMPGVLLFNVLQVLSQVLYATGSPRRVVRLALAGLALNVICNVLFIESLGLTGVALASTLSYSLLGLGVLRLVGREFKVPVRELVVPRMDDFNVLSFLRRRPPG